MKKVGLLLVASCLSLPLGSCTLDPKAGISDGVLQCNNDQTFFIQLFQLVNEMSMCVASPTNTQVSSSGTLDVGFLSQLKMLGNDLTGLGYWATPSVQNNLIDTATVATGETADINVTGFNVQILAPPGFTLPSSITPTHYFVPSAAGVAPPAGGKVSASAEVLSAQTALAFKPFLNTKSFGSSVLLHIQPIGDRGGSTVYGGCTLFPIDLCVNCISDVIVCPTDGYNISDVTLGGCREQQDDPITCCSNADTGEVLCGARVPTKS